MKHPKPQGKFTRFERSFCLNCLWELTEEIPVTAKPKEDIKYLLHRIYWEDGTIHQVLIAKTVPDREYHKERMEKALLNFPILLCVYPDRSYDILDGAHRLAKAFLVGEESWVMVRYCDPLVFRLITEQMRGGLKRY